jgi:hypothetical protein
MNEIDAARLAAYIDGEGCIAAHHHRQKDKNGKIYEWHVVGIHVYNTDPRLPLWCKKITQIGNMKEDRTFQRSKNARICFVWRVYAQAAAEILKECLPYFILKREQAEIAIAIQATKKSHPGKPVSVELYAAREKMANELSQLKKRPFENLTLQ